LNQKCKKAFLHAAKKYSVIQEKSPIIVSPESALELLQKYPQGCPPYPLNSVEKHVCPFCESPEIDELRIEERKITSVRSVDLADVDELLKKGYSVHELYAKNAVLVLYEERALEGQ
jgi:hypothetical protein